MQLLPPVLGRSPAPYAGDAPLPAPIRAVAESVRAGPRRSMIG